MRQESSLLFNWLMFIDEILADLAWREWKISQLKKIIVNSSSPSDQELLYSFWLVHIYALWEGFIKQSFEIYIREINSLWTKGELFANCIITHHIDETLRFTERIDYSKKLSFIDEIRSFIDGTPTLTITPHTTNSNIDHKNLLQILWKFNVTVDNKYLNEHTLWKLLHMRWKVAHWDSAIQISKIDFEELSEFILNLMVWVCIWIDNAWNRSSYLKV